ncbi:unnamed protein product [Closterium sp. NIES-64]|nr:unnamed protein product [Closterium sp. NIES-64]
MRCAREAGRARRDVGREWGEAGRECGEVGRERGEAGKEGGEVGREWGEAGKEGGEVGRERGEAGKERGEAGREGGEAGREGREAGEKMVGSGKGGELGLRVGMVDAVNRQEKKGLEGGSEGSEREGKRQRKGLDRWWRCEKGESRGGEREDGCGGGADAGAGDAGAREGGFGGAARRDVAEEACRGQACVGEAGMGRRDEAGMGRRDEAGMEVASRSARLAWDVFSRGGRQHKVIYLIRHAHTSFSAPPPHTPLPSAPIPLASHLPLSRSASACPSASPPPAPPHTSPPLLPCQAYRHHLRRGHDVPLSPLGRQQAMDLHPTLIHIAQKSQLLLVSPLSRALETLCYALHLNTPTATTCHCCNAPCTTTSILGPPCCTAPHSSNAPHHPFNSSAKPLNSIHQCPHTPHGQPHACSKHVAGPGDMGRDKEILASDFPFPFLSFSHLPHHWWPHHPSHPPPTPLPSTHTPPAIPATPSPASPPPPAPITGPAAAAAGTWGAVAEPRGAPASSPPCTTPLPFAPTLPAPSSAASNPPSLHEPRAILRKRVGEFRRFLFACPEATIAVIGHSTFFMEFLASRRRMKNCEIVKICL